MSDKEPRSVILDPLSEFRFEVSADNSVNITVESGVAEVFGCELLLSKPYIFSGSAKSCLFSHSGCKLLVAGPTTSEYVSEDSYFLSVAALHFALEEFRKSAAALHQNEDTKDRFAPGPRVLVLGTGRTSLCRVLLNYAVRQGHSPLWVDMDLMNGSMVFPGVLGATVLDRAPITPSEEITATTDILTFFYALSGSSVSGDPKALFGPSIESPQYLRAIIERLGAAICERMEKDRRVNISGLICSGFPWFFNSSTESSSFCEDLLKLIIASLKIDTLVVVGNEKLFFELDKKLTNVTDIKTLKMRHSSGYVLKDSSFRRSLLAQRIARYFNGGGLGTSPLETAPFQSFPVIVPFKDLHIRRIGDLTPQAPLSALPIGSSIRRIEDYKIIRVELLAEAAVAASVSGSAISTIVIQPSSLLHSVLALSSAPVDQESSIVDAPVVGFVAVTEVDEIKSRLVLMAPAPGRLPKSFLLWSPFSSLKSAMLR